MNFVDSSNSNFYIEVRMPYHILAQANEQKNEIITCLTEELNALREEIILLKITHENEKTSFKKKCSEEAQNVMIDFMNKYTQQDSETNDTNQHQLAANSRNNNDNSNQNSNDTENTTTPTATTQQSDLFAEETRENIIFITIEEAYCGCTKIVTDVSKDDKESIYIVNITKGINNRDTIIVGDKTYRIRYLKHPYLSRKNDDLVVSKKVLMANGVRHPSSSIVYRIDNKNELLQLKGFTNDSKTVLDE
ncbi:hypothetical protein EIN_116750 [Entamoeba invadens IP1]|uniref:Uncharacterized protein n=1 Tax=Entamoeba invadens IP1 TaxID=370355 RepID=L7FQI7_ENTIV|nr:hypothetical protein EIN_116750 [Entamoeba invadens IP1]ELP94544.1 hypothetical protein EIN_116750 [Entamoeba invadens IP1]|eukprot:XP_004261315.1 hypothetical protein EIN_116750 [Entamoeba invadens IP1]